MSKTYVITDIHGRADLLVKALTIIPQDSKIVFLGDYIDRGPDSKAVVNIIKQGVANYGMPWVVLIGNHEDMAIRGILDKEQIYEDCWLGNGGVQAWASYDSKEELVEDLTWLRTLPLFHRDPYRMYIHAYADPQKDAYQFSKQDALWKRYGNTDNVGWRGRHVVHGHTPQKEPLLLSNRTNLDTGANWSGKLSVGVFNDDIAGGPIEVIKVQM